MDQINKGLFSNLEVGHEFGSYPKMCLELGIKKKGGNARRAQLKEIERYIKLERIEGSKYKKKVVEIYDVPLLKEDDRGKYNQLVQLLLTDYFAKSNKQVLELTLNDILRLVNLINYNYSLASNNVPKFSKYLGIEEQITYDHFSLTHNSLKKNIERVLDNLSDMHLINVHKDVVFISDSDSNKRVATDDEIELFEQAGEEALDEIFKDKSRSNRKISNVRFTKYWHKYRTISSKKFVELMKKEKGESVKSAYMGYRIVLNRKAIKKAHDELLIEYLDDATRKHYLDEVETIVLNDLIKKAINRHEKAKNINSKISERMRSYRMMFGYVKDNKKIIELTHSQQALDLTNEFSKKKERKLKDEEKKVINDVLK